MVSLLYAIANHECKHKASWRPRVAGLVDVGGEGRVVFAHGGSPGTAIHRANLRQTGDLAVQAGLVSADDLANVLRIIEDPSFMFALPLLVTAWGRTER